VAGGGRGLLLLPRFRSAPAVAPGSVPGPHPGAHPGRRPVQRPVVVATERLPNSAGQTS